MPVDQLALAAGVADPRAHPLSGLANVRGARGVGADRFDPQKLGELVEPVGHGRERIDSAQYTAGTNVCSSIGGRMYASSVRGGSSSGGGVRSS